MEAEVPVDTDAISSGTFEGKLEGAEEPGRAWDCHGYESQLSKDLLPAFARDACGGGEFAEDLGQLYLTVR